MTHLYQDLLHPTGRQAPYRLAALAAAVVIFSTGAVTHAGTDQNLNPVSTIDATPEPADIFQTEITKPGEPTRSAAEADAAYALNVTRRTVAAELNASAERLFEDTVTSVAGSAPGERKSQRIAADVDAGRALEATRSAVYAELSQTAENLYVAHSLEPPQVIRDLESERLAADIDATRALAGTHDAIVAELNQNAAELFYTSNALFPATAARLSAFGATVENDAIPIAYRGE